MARPFTHTQTHTRARAHALSLSLSEGICQDDIIWLIMCLLVTISSTA
jgi:hypothetical protein